MKSPQQSPSAKDFHEQKGPAKLEPMSFEKIFESLTKDLKVRRLEWPEGYYLEIRNEKLMLYRPDTDAFHPLIVNLGDINGKDWVVVI